MKERKLMFARALKLIKPHYKVTITYKDEISKEAKHWLNQCTHVTHKELKKRQKDIDEAFIKFAYTGVFEFKVEDGQ